MPNDLAPAVALRMLAVKGVQ